MRIQPIAIVTLLQVAPLASATGPLEFGGRPIEEDAVVARTSVGRKRSQLHHKSHQRRHQKGVEAYDRYMGLAAHRELAGHDGLDNDQQHHSMSYSISISMSMPPATPPAMMCEFCPDGLTVEPETLLPTDDGATCAAAMAFAGTLPAGLALCETVQLAQLFCCPAPASSIPLPETTSTTTEATTTSTTTTTEEPTTTTSTSTATEEATTTTEAPPATLPEMTTEATEPATAEAPLDPTEAPGTTDTYAAKASKGMFTSKSAKADTKSAKTDAKAEKMTSVAKTHKTPKNPMAKVAKASDHDEEETHDGVDSKSGKAKTDSSKSGKVKSELDAKAEKISTKAAKKQSSKSGAKSSKVTTARVRKR